MPRKGPLKRRRKPSQPVTPVLKKKSDTLFCGHLSHTSPVPSSAEGDLKITDYFPAIVTHDVPDVASYEEVSDLKPKVLQRIFRKSKDNVEAEQVKTEKSDDAVDVTTHNVETAQEFQSTTCLQLNLASSPKAALKPKTLKGKRKLNTNQSLNQENHKLTEYFTIRRSVRKTKSCILEEKQRTIEEAILSGREDGLEVHYFPMKGRGVIATRLFRKSEYVVEYAGDLIDLVEARNRELRYAADQNTGCYMYYFQYKSHSYCIDATAESTRLGRLVNHSRCGNLVPKILEIKDRPHLVLVARRDIPPGEEILYDYGDRSKDSLKHHPWLAF